MKPRSLTLIALALTIAWAPAAAHGPAVRHAAVAVELAAPTSTELPLEPPERSAERSAKRLAERSPDLSVIAQTVIDYLLADWKQQFRSTSFPNAMSNLGIEPDDDLRLEIAEHFRDNSNLANNLQWWGTNNYIFSNLEKRLAKYLINALEKDERVPDPAETAAALGISEAELASRLDFMSRAGFAQEAAGEELGYELAPGYRRWAGPLQHNFHTVTIEGERPFDVW